MLHFEVCVENIHSICIVWMLYSECIKWAIMFNLPNNTKQINNFDLCCALWDTCKLVQWLFHQHSVVLFTCKRPLLVYSQLSPSKWVHHKMFNDHFTADFTLFSNTCYIIALTLAYTVSKRLVFVRGFYYFKGLIFVEKPVNGRPGKPWGCSFVVLLLVHKMAL